jgi:hypothetical protein
MSMSSEMTRTPKRTIVSVSVRKFNSGIHFAVNNCSCAKRKRSCPTGYFRNFEG